MDTARPPFPIHPDVTSVLVGARSNEHIDNALAALAMGMDAEMRAEMSRW